MSRVKNNPINLHDICADCEDRFKSLHNCMECCGVPLAILQAHEDTRNSKESEVEE